MNSYRLVALVLTLALSAPMVHAAEESGPEGVAKVRQSMELLLPGLPLGEIRPAPIPGFFEVVIGQEVTYVSADGHYLMKGTLIDLELQKNLTEPRENEIKSAAIAGVGEENMVVFGSEMAKHTLTVFTDIDCGYCRKLHGEMAAYNDAGIRIRYLFYPRAGLGSDSYRKAVAVWCAEDRQAAMTSAKRGEDPGSATCENPVADHYALGRNLGITGTPALVLDSGQVVPGYVPADRLLAALEEAASPAAR